MNQADATPSPEFAAPAAPKKSLRLRGVALALAGLGFAATAFSLATGIWELNSLSAYQAALSAGCQNNLKQMGLVFKMYANESRGEAWPPLSTEAGNLMAVADAIYPEYMSDADILVCPAPLRDHSEGSIDGTFYVYTGYVLRSDEDVQHFAESYTARLAGGGDFTTDLTESGTTVRRLREGIERLYVTDINNPVEAWRIRSEIPVLWDWPDNHQQGWGGNVLYMDGHVKWVAYPGEFPMTEATFTALAELANYTPPEAWQGVPTGGSQLGAKCQNRFKQLGLMHKMYANESQGEKWPQLSGEPGKLMFEAPNVYPEYIKIRDFLRCPGRADAPTLPRFDDDHFVYWGYYLTNDEDVQAFAQAYSSHLAGGGDFSGDLPVPSSYGDSIGRLREGIERFLITDVNNPGIPFQAQSKTPVMLEWPDNHEGQSGGNVLFMDGHVEWIDYPGKFPMTESTINALRSIAQPVAPTVYAETERAYWPENDPYNYASVCRGSIQSLGRIFEYFPNRDSNYSPPALSTVEGRLMFDETSLYPRYIENPEWMVCPGATFTPTGSLLDDQHYAYLGGYLLFNDSDVQAFASAYTARLAQGGDFTTNLPGPTSYADEIERYHRDVWYYWPTSPPDTPLEELPVPGDVPVFIEWPGHHEGLSGGHVVYLDGTTVWRDYPGEFPMTEATIATLSALAGRTPPSAWNSRSFTTADDPYDQALCQRNITSIWIALATFHNISNDYFPTLSAQPHTLSFDDDRFVQFHLFDLRRMNCPGSPAAYRQPADDDHSYAYLGYRVHDQVSLERFAAAYAQAIAGTPDFSQDLEWAGKVVPRLRDINPSFLLDATKLNPADYVGDHEIPLLIEWPDNHGNLRGGNVLYLNGTIEWMDYPGEFPMTEEAMAILTELAGRGPIREAMTRGGKRLEKDPKGLVNHGVHEGTDKNYKRVH